MTATTVRDRCGGRLTPAEHQLMAARTALVLDEPFFGALALRLALHEDPGCGTAWVDGATLGYDPAWIASLSHAETVALVAHEVMHCAAGHPWRRDGRDPKNWNQAADLAINSELADAGFHLPASGLMPDAQQKGKSAEWIYARLPEPPPAGGDGDGQGDGGAGSQLAPGPPNPQGEVRDAPAAADVTEQEWAEAVQQAAAQAKARGKLAASLDRFAATAVEPRVDWRSILRRFVQQAARADYSWTRPNQRYAALGIYLPCLRSEEMGPLAIAIDTSGSIDDTDLAVARAELLAVIEECSPSRVHVYYADAAVARADTYERGEPVEFRPAGGGGTDFRPVFAAAEALEEPPAALIYITDLDGACPESSEIPTLWVTASARQAPFGEGVRL